MTKEQVSSDTTNDRKLIVLPVSNPETGQESAGLEQYLPLLEILNRNKERLLEVDQLLKKV